MDPPFPPDNFNEEEYTIELEESIAGVSLCVHLFNEEAGRYLPSRVAIAFPEFLFNIAKDKKISQYTWIPDKVTIPDITDAKYKRFLNKLRASEDMDPDFIISRSFPHLVPAEVIEHIESIIETGYTNPVEKPNVLLDFHTKDTEYVAHVIPYITSKGCIPLIIQETDESEQNIKDFQNKLKQATSMIICYGNVARSWVNQRIDEAIKHVSVFHNKNRKEFKAIGLHLFPPPAPDKMKNLKIPTFFKVIKLDNSSTHQFNPEVLIPFFECIGGNV